MSINTENVLRHVPHLRRHARLLSGSKDVGDEYVRIALELIMAEPERLAGGDERILLFRAFHAVWSALNESGRRRSADAVTIEERLDQGLAALAPIERRVLLLAVVEEMSLEQVALVLDLDVGAVRRLPGQGAREPAAGGRAARADHRGRADDRDRAQPDRAGHGADRCRAPRRGRTRRWSRPMAGDEQLGLVLADIQLPDSGNGIVAAQQILERYNVPIVFVTGFPERLLTGSGLEPAFVVAKPFEPESLKVTIAHALSTYASEKDAVAHRANMLAKLREITARRDQASPGELRR